jgi:hypothetical protein
MRSSVRWPALALAGVILLIGWSMTATRGEDAAPPTTAPAGGKISGVVTQNGQPVAGAMVRLVKPGKAAQQVGGTTQPNVQGLDAGAPTPKPGKAGKAAAKAAAKGKPVPVTTATTDEQGHFILSDVPPGEYAVQAGIKGQAVGRARVSVVAGQEVNVSIQLREKPATKKQN